MGGPGSKRKHQSQGMTRDQTESRPRISLAAAWGEGVRWGKRGKRDRSCLHRLWGASAASQPSQPAQPADAMQVRLRRCKRKSVRIVFGMWSNVLYSEIVRTRLLLCFLRSAMSGSSETPPRRAWEMVASGMKHRPQAKRYGDTKILNL